MRCRLPKEQRIAVRRASAKLAHEATRRKHADPTRHLCEVCKVNLTRFRNGYHEHTCDKCHLPPDVLRAGQIERAKYAAAFQKRDVCRRGHPRTPENLTYGSCRECRKITMTIRMQDPVYRERRREQWRTYGIGKWRRKYPDYSTVPKPTEEERIYWERILQAEGLPMYKGADQFRLFYGWQEYGADGPHGYVARDDI